MYRNKSYDEKLSKELHNRKFAQEFILGLMEGKDGMRLEEALRHTIAKMGVKEFALLARIPAPNIVEFLKGKRSPKPETLEKYLKPFHLKTRLMVEKAS